jgi:hypothetical protein
LRAASAHALLEADKALHDPALQHDDFLWLRATIDGAVLPRDPRALLQEAPARPVIIGSNRAEFGLPGGRPHRDADVDDAFGARTDKARAFYRLDAPIPPRTQGWATAICASRRTFSSAAPPEDCPTCCPGRDGRSGAMNSIWHPMAGAASMPPRSAM